jgi:3-deoxy-D-manno-octulosonic-acid transferase
MRLLLDLAYLAVAAVASPWIAYRLAAAGAWKGFGARFGVGLGAPTRRAIWLHASSVGEATQLRPLVERLERDFPDVPLVISAFTVTGLAAARKAYPRHRTILFPVDLSLVVDRFLRHFDPKLVIIVESDYWPNFLAGARRRRVPVAVVSGKMSPKAHRIYARTRLLPRLLGGVALIAVQSEEHAERLASLGIPRERLKVTGNMKYDLAGPGDARNERDARDTLREALGYQTKDLVIIGGSLHEGEDEVLLEAYHRALEPGRACGAPSRLGLIVVPRYPGDAAAVERRVRARGWCPVRKSVIDSGRESAPGTSGVLVVDTLGELGRLYGAADVAFVGGSLFYRASNKGGHNLMEPAILGVPVLFGPYNFSFQETVHALLEENAGIMVHDATELGRALERLAADESGRCAMGERARGVMVRRQGATERNIELLAGLLGADERLPASPPDSTMPPRVSDAGTQ